MHSAREVYGPKDAVWLLILRFHLILKSFVGLVHTLSSTLVPRTTLDPTVG